MKTFLLSASVLLSITVSGQKKDFTEKQLLKNKRVIEFANSMQTTPKNTIDFLKCIKTESKINEFKKLPFFTGKLTLIVDDRIKQHNDELWEAIHEDCKNSTIFINN